MILKKWTLYLVWKHCWPVKKAPIEKLYNEIEVLSKLTVAQEIFFVYDVSSILKNTFISKLDKYIIIYGSISYFEKIKENNQLDLITMRNKLKFHIQRDIYQEEIEL